MNDKIDKIYSIGMTLQAFCVENIGNDNAAECFAGMAESIYYAHVKPMEDALAASKERERVLMEALKDRMERIPAFESKKNQDVLKQARAALDSVKEI